VRETSYNKKRDTNNSAVRCCL